MSSLAGKTLLSTYTSLLKLEGDTQTLVAGGGTAIQIKTGDNEVTPIYLNTDRVGIGIATPSSDLHVKGGICDVTIEGNSTGYTDAAVVFISQQASARGGGCYAVNLIDDREWFWGRPYNDDAFAIHYNNNAATHQPDTADDAATGVSNYFHVKNTGNVGIGTATPASNTNLHLSSADDTTTFRISDDDTTGYVNVKDSYISIGKDVGLTADNLNISTSTGNVGIGTVAPDSTLTTQGTTIKFKSSGGEERFIFQPDTNSNQAQFKMYAVDGVTERVHLDSYGHSWFLPENGNVGIGTTTPDAHLEVVAISEYSEITATTYSGTDGHTSSLNLRKSAGTTDGTPAYTVDDEALGEIDFYGVNDLSTDAFGLAAQIMCLQDAAKTTTMSGRLTFKTYNAGSAIEALTILKDGMVELPKGQLKFPATQNASADANTLDDYEEGTFTPEVSFDGGSGTVAYDTQNGQYTKIGNRVFGALDVRTTSIASRTGNVKISGLPFVSGGSTQGGLSVLYATGLALPSVSPVNGFTEPSTDYFYLWNVDTVAGGSYLQHDEWTADGRMLGFFQYII